MQILPIDLIPDELLLKLLYPLVLLFVLEESKIKKSSRRKTKYCFKFRKESENQLNKKWQDLHRTAQPRTLAMFPSWESAGAGRVGGLASANIQPFIFSQEL
jgi:hypothetical protein